MERERKRKRERERVRERERESERKRERKRERVSHTYKYTHYKHIKVAKLIDEINKDGRAKKYTNMSSRENSRQEVTGFL